MSFFQNSVLNKYIKAQEATKVKAAYENFKEYFHNPAIQENIRNSKEEQFQEGFLRELFVKIFGFVLNPDPDFNLTTELKNEKGAKKTDGAILKDGKALAVIELKGTDTKDLDKVNTQAFNYKNNQTGCIYVITSNFEKLRFFIHDSVTHLEFNLFKLKEEEFTLMWLCLASENLLSGIPLKIKEESVLAEENITKQLYKDYSAFKTALWQNLVKNQPKQDQLTLFKKTQKLLDRFLFIFFAEDSGLLPPNSISEIIKKWNEDSDWGDDKSLYDIYKQYFHFINVGRPPKGKRAEIFGYNGGLFAEDEVLDNVVVDDEVLLFHTKKLTNYDFQSEVDVNILGHIFENSLNEIETITAQLEGQEIDKSKTKRKKDGVFYTPKYITKYIVDNTVSKLCEDKKTELGIIDEEYAKGRKNRKKEIVKKLDTNLKAYRDWLLDITICDPACGSGAFLNQALEFLIDEHAYIDELKAQLFGDAMVFQDVSNHILEKNIFGVDINDESVEIAKLSLWLRTAQRGRKLTSLNNNIKCGNSLIDDPKVAGEKAFNWQKEFPAIFEKGGFDVIVGNPPYVRQEVIKPFKDYFSKNFQTYQSTADLYVYFMEMSIDKLLSKNGIYSIIVANKWMRANYGKPLRTWLKNKKIFEIIDFGDLPVFEDATAYPCIITVKGGSPSKTFSGVSVNTLSFSSVDYFVKTNAIEINQSLLDDNSWTLQDEKETRLISKLKNKGIPLKDFINNKMYVGLKTGYNAAFIIDETQYLKFVEGDERNKEVLKPYVVGRDITRYGKPLVNKYLICFPSKWTNSKGTFSDENEAWSWLCSNYKDVSGYLSQFIEQAKKRTDKGEYWWELRSCDYYNEFESPKIIYSEIASEGRFTIDTEKVYCDMTAFFIGNNSPFLLAILNSKLFTFLFKHSSSEIRGGFLRWKRQYMYPLPIPKSSNEQDFGDFTKRISKCVASYQLIIANLSNHLRSKFEVAKLTTKLQNWHKLELKDFLKELKKAKIKLSLSEEAEWMQYFNEQKQKAQDLKSEINRIDSEIDKMVYELYELTDEEIKIVEGSN